jgi:hypothetical protein
MIDPKNKSSEIDIVGPSNKKFGLTFAIIFFVIGLFLWYEKAAVVFWPMVLGATFLGLGLFLPKSLNALNLLWLKFGLLLHRVTSPIILATMFYLLITPMGILMRVFGRCPIDKKFNAQLNSYWIVRDPPGSDPESMRNQF